MPRFGKDKDARKEELDRQAAEEVERLTRRGGPPGMGGGMGGGGPMGRIGIPSPLEQIAEEVRDAPRPSMRREAPRRPAPRPQQAFTPLPSGEVGSSFGPGGLNPVPRTAGGAPPPPSFGGGAYDDDFGGHVVGPPVYNLEPDEEEEMTITEMALMDHAARTGHNPEDLVMTYDAGTAEQMRDAAMRQFYERQQARRPGAGTNNPFAPAGMRGGPSGPVALPRRDDPATAGGALAQRLANKRRREEEEARRSRAAAPPAPASQAARAPTAAAAAPARAREAEVDEGALARVLARRRQALRMDEPEPQPEPEPSPAPGRRHASARQEQSPGLRAEPLNLVVDPVAPSLEDMAESIGGRRGRPRKDAAAPAAKKATKAATTKAATTKAATTKAATTKAATTKTTPKKAAAQKTAPAAKAPAAPKTAAAKTVFCIECGEKNPAVAKFCFNCGTRLAVPEGRPEGS